MVCRIFVAVLILYEIGKIQEKIGNNKTKKPTILMLIYPLKL